MGLSFSHKDRFSRCFVPVHMRTAQSNEINGFTPLGVNEVAGLIKQTAIYVSIYNSLKLRLPVHSKTPAGRTALRGQCVSVLF